jgi:hypothetical protein
MERHRKRDLQHAGAPSGQIRSIGGVNLAGEVRRLVEIWIEKRPDTEDG